MCSIDELRALALILLQAPPAVLRGRFDVDENHSVYGFPARIIGLLLLQIVVWATADAVYWGGVVGAWDMPPEYLLLRVASFIGSILLAAILCVVYREPRRQT